MASATDAPVDLYIAAYDDPGAARGDWDTIKDLAKEDVIKRIRRGRQGAVRVRRGLRRRERPGL